MYIYIELYIYFQHPISEVLIKLKL